MGYREVMGRESSREICKTSLTQFWNQKLQGLEAELKTTFLKIKGHTVQVYHMSSGNACILNWKNTIYQFMVSICRQSLKAWLRFPFLFLRQVKKEKKEAASFTPDSFAPQTKHIVSKDCPLNIKSCTVGSVT